MLKFEEMAIFCKLGRRILDTPAWNEDLSLKELTDLKSALRKLRGSVLSQLNGKVVGHVPN